MPWMRAVPHRTPRATMNTSWSTKYWYKEEKVCRETHKRWKETAMRDELEMCKGQALVHGLTLCMCATLLYSANDTLLSECEKAHLLQNQRNWYLLQTGGQLLIFSVFMFLVFAHETVGGVTQDRFCVSSPSSVSLRGANKSWFNGWVQKHMSMEILTLEKVK